MDLPTFFQFEGVITVALRTRGVFFGTIFVCEITPNNVGCERLFIIFIYASTDQRSSDFFP